MKKNRHLVVLAALITARPALASDVKPGVESVRELLEVTRSQRVLDDALKQG